VQPVLNFGWHFSQGHPDAIISRQTSELERPAKYDSLTGLANRRAIKDLLRQEMQRVERYGTSMMTMLFQVWIYRKYYSKLWCY
jgi:PleD family two-component response regulator